MPSPRRALHALVALSILSTSLFAGCAPAASGTPTNPMSTASPPASGTPNADASAAPRASSSAEPLATNAAGAESGLAKFTKTFLADYLKREPVRATEIGEHRYDASYPDMSAEGEAEIARFLRSAMTELRGMPVELLSLQSRIDREIIINHIESRVFAIEELKESEWSPLTYTGMIGDGLDPLINRSFAPIEERMKSVRSRLEGIPAVVAVAKKRLQNPPEIHTKTAIQQNAGLIELCEKGLAEHIAKVPAQKAELEAAAKKAAAALKDFQAFLEKDLLPRSKGDFRIGPQRFARKLTLALDDPSLDTDAIVPAARALLEKTQGEMAVTAKELWPELMKGKPLPPDSTADQKKALVRAVLDKIAEDRSTNATIVSDAKKMLGEAAAFVKTHDLVRVPDEPCDVIEMPEYRRGVAVAYCDASGPLEQKQETFYTISPTPADWPKKRVDSFYREYNKSMLADLTIHEAMPGHFLQLMHNNKFSSTIRAVLSSGPFIEGWAVYAEWLMAKYGFGGPKVRMMQQKMLIRLCANAILDHEVHAGKLDEKGALDLMMKDAFQEEGEAVGKWKRARLTSAQLTTYYYGFVEMMKLRTELEKAPGFKERAYHDKLLSFGSPSMRHLRAIMTAKD